MISWKLRYILQLHMIQSHNYLYSKTDMLFLVPSFLKDTIWSFYNWKHNFFRHLAHLYYIISLLLATFSLSFFCIEMNKSKTKSQFQVMVVNRNVWIVGYARRAAASVKMGMWGNTANPRDVGTLLSSTTVSRITSGWSIYFFDNIQIYIYICL